MAWTTPKTNWAATYDSDGNYTGDYFTYNDFNRIRNNLDALTEYASTIYLFTFTDTLPSTKTVTGYPYASDINKFETRLHELNSQSLHMDIGTKQVFNDNGSFITADELNRIESAMLNMYSVYQKVAGGRKMLKFRLGFPASSIRF